MTAPLPPLDEYGFWTSEFCKTYAKLAVRVALERAAKICDFNTDYVSANAIRAMIEEYTND